MKRHRQKSKTIAPRAQHKRSPGDVLVLVGVLALAAVGVYWFVQHRSSPAASAGSNSVGPGGQLISKAPLPPAKRESVETIRQWVTNLSELDLKAGEVSPAQAEQWTQAVQRLVQQGSGAVAPIREFLARNIDLDFDTLKGGESLGYPTLRLALIDVLRQVPGTESVAVEAQVLEVTADPREIAYLGRNLDQQAPGQHRQAAVTAARAALAQAARGQLEGPDIGPLFEVLQHFGGANVVEDVESVATKWNFYATVALGGLPGGAGIPALARLAQDSSIPNVMSLRVLAQIAPEFPEARKVLEEQVKANKVPFTAWTALQAALSGEIIEYGAPVFAPATTSANAQNLRLYHISYGNQNYRTVAVADTWPEARVQQQLALIDQLIAADSNLETLQFLQDARLSLAARVKK